MDVLRSNYLPGSEPGLLPVLAHQTPVQVRHAETVRLDLPDAIAAGHSARARPWDLAMHDALTKTATNQ